MKTLTREEVLKLTCGDKLDALIEEHVFGGQWVPANEVDLERCENILTVDERTVVVFGQGRRGIAYLPVCAEEFLLNNKWLLGARIGTEKLFYGGPKYSRDPTAAWEVVIRMSEYGFNTYIDRLIVPNSERVYNVVSIQQEKIDGYAQRAGMPECVCKAALYAIISAYETGTELSITRRTEIQS